MAGKKNIPLGTMRYVSLHPPLILVLIVDQFGHVSWSTFLPK